MELRLIIYKYVLQAQDGVVCRSTLHNTFQCFAYLSPAKVDSEAGGRDIAEEDEPIIASAAEVNQLKYVCRQTRFETESLTMAINEVLFENGVNSFNDFTKACPAATLSKLRSVTILAGDEAERPRNGGFCDDAALSSLLKFCSDFPNATVRLRHKEFHPVTQYDVTYRARRSQ